MSYAGVLTRLRAYQPKALYTGAFGNAEGHCCALGAAVPALRRMTVATISGVEKYRPDVFRELLATGLTRDEAFELMATNERCAGTPALRYDHVIGWLEQRVAT